MHSGSRMQPNEYLLRHSGFEQVGECQIWNDEQSTTGGTTCFFHIAMIGAYDAS